MANGFAYYSKGHLPNCVMAIYCWVCRTRCPSSTECAFPMSYRNRHECWGIVVLPGCDANLKFHMFSTKSTGSTNDVIAWDISAVKAMLDDGKLPHPFHFIGDEAFRNEQQMLVPWSLSGGRFLATIAMQL